MADPAHSRPTFRAVFRPEPWVQLGAVQQLRAALKGLLRHYGYRCLSCEEIGGPMDRVIVSRHPATVEFLRAEAPEFASAAVLATAGPDDVRGRVVGGNLPMHLAALAAEVWAVEFAGAPPRGQEFGLAEMRAAGARLARYRVVAL